MKATGWTAIEMKETNNSIVLNKYADPTEGELLDITADNAIEIAEEDPSLIWADVDDETAWWAWHDADSSRHYSTTEEAEAACAAWVSGDSDDGPDRGGSDDGDADEHYSVIDGNGSIDSTWHNFDDALARAEELAEQQAEDNADGDEDPEETSGYENGDDPRKGPGNWEAGACPAGDGGGYWPHVEWMD